MRIVHLSDEECRAFLGGPSVRSRRATEHLMLCDLCQTQLAVTAEQNSLVGQMAASPLDPSLADRVIQRVARRSYRKAVGKTIFYSASALVTTAVVIFVVGPDLYSKAIQPVWGMLVSGLSGLAGILEVSVASIKSLSAGPTILTLAAVAAVLWVGLLDKLAGRVRLLRSRA